MRRLLLVCPALACLSTGALAQRDAPPPPPAPPQPHPLTHMDIERFADSVFARYLREFASASLAVVVVRGDSVVFAKGYGHERDSLPVSLDSTVFHIASLSKLFVVAAVLQQVERGRLVLDTPVSNVLPELAIPRDVTLRHLLTHTSGMDSPFLRGVVDDASELAPLSEAFARHPPRFGRPPGREIRYSNYGMALAALLVERVSGESFDAYVERHIFAPLGMRGSAIRQPLSPSMDRRVATAGSGRTPDYLLIYPAGAIVSTPADMGRFMRALLAAPDSASAILSGRSLSEMARRQWGAQPATPGVALGFFESDMGGVRALFHTGARTHFSLIYLLPEQRVGVFLVHSMRQGGPFQSLRTEFARAFVERYFRTATAVAERPDTPAASSVAGTYRPVLFSSGTIEKAAWLLADTRVAANADGSLVVDLPAGNALRLVPRGGAYRVVDGPQEGLAFAFSYADTSGRRMFMSGATQDPVSFDRLAWYERGVLHLALLAVAYAVIAGHSLVMLVAAGWRAVTKRARRNGGAADVRSQTLLLVPGVLLTIGPVIAVAMLLLSSGSAGPRRAIGVGATSVFVGGLLALASVPIAITAWRKSYWGGAQRTWVTAFAACAIALVTLLTYYHVGPMWIQ